MVDGAAPSFPRSVDRLLVIPPAAGCDALIVPLKHVRSAMPRATIVLLADPAVGGRVDVDEVVPDRALARFDPADLSGLIAELAATRLAAAVVFTDERESAFEAAYLAYLAGVRVRAGFAGEFGGGVLAPAVAPPPVGTAGAARHLFLLDALGLGATATAAVKARLSCDDSAS
jgi:hypothetical protein